MDLAALTSAITDIIVDVTDTDLERFRIKKGFLANTCHQEEAFREFIAKKNQQVMPAGSSANVLFNLSQYNLKTALLGTVGSDLIGENYIQFVSESGITSLLNVSDGPSAVCYVLVTPDSERTVFTKIGVAYRYDFDLLKLRDATFFHTSGYELLTNPERTKESISYAKQKGAKISFDLSDPVVIQKHRSDLETVLRQTDILFATTEEAHALTGVHGEDSLNKLKYICPVIALKMGEKGSIVTDGREKYVIPINQVRVVNTCGAGDAYAAGFLNGQIEGSSIKQSGHMGSYLASRVCERKESHL